MSKMIKPLEWFYFDDVVCANPVGLRYGYYIKQIKNKRTFELAYVENNGNFKEHGVVFKSIESAQAVAFEHYYRLISANILDLI